MDCCVIIFQHPQTWVILSQWRNAWRINSFLCSSGEAYFCFKMTQPAHNMSCCRTVRIGGLETCRDCNNHRDVWVRWDVALCSCCWCEIRQGKFHIFNLVDSSWQVFLLLYGSTIAQASDGNFTWQKSQKLRLRHFLLHVASCWNPLT